MLIPYSTEVLLTRWPISNIAIMAACVITTFLVFTGTLGESVVMAMVLDGWSPLGLFGYQFLHADLLHLLVNMLYLWVFGNAVCETVGNARYPMIFFGLGILAAVVHNLFDGTPAIGASGAVNGIIGFYLVLFPANRVSCFYWFFIRMGVFDIAGFWLILFWFLFDAWGAFSGSNTGIAYWAHVGGFLSGAGLGVLFETRGWAKLQHYDNPSLVDFLYRNRTREPAFKSRRAREQTLQECGHAHQADMAQVVSAPCPHCGVNLNIRKDMTGRRANCPACNGEIDIEG